MNTITIPSTIEGAVSELGEIGLLLTAKSWHRAAIVYAFSAPQNTRADIRNFEQFAALNIHGLRSHGTVSEYWHVWQTAIDAGKAKPVKPGDKVKLPKDEFPHFNRSRGIGFAPGTPLERRVEQIIKLFAEDEELRRAVEDSFVVKVIAQPQDPFAKRVENAFVQRAAHDGGLVLKVQDSYKEHHIIPVMPERTPSALGTLGFGGEVYGRVQDHINRHLTGLLDYLRQQANAGNPNVGRLAADENESLEKTVTLVRQAQDKISASAGVDAEAVFRRLVGQE